MSAIDDFLINIAIYGSIGGVAIILLKNRFPDYWEIVFPSKQQQYEAKIVQLQGEQKKLELQKNTLIKYKEARQKVNDLTKEVNQLTTDIDFLEHPAHFKSPKRVEGNK